MPPRKTTGAAAPAAADQQADATPSTRSAPRRPARMKTFSETVKARETTESGPKDKDMVTRSFLLPVGLVERVRATADGIQHRAYGTDLEGQVPRSVGGKDGLVAEALAAICTYYENEFNNGEEFRRIRGSLTAGPSPEGARRGAAKRAAARQSE
jgi:hypothetical protein